MHVNKKNFYMVNATVSVGYLVSVYKVRVFVIPAEAGIQKPLKILDSGLKTAGMTESTR